MKIGVFREIKPQEGRVSLLPKQVKELVDDGHEVCVETNAGLLSGADDEAYIKVGAKIYPDAKSLYEWATLLVKVKEILPPEFGYMKKDHILVTCIHSAHDRKQLDVLLDAGLIGIATEEIHDFGSPNCPLAGEVGAFEGLRLTLAPHGGTGRHFMTHYGAKPTKAVVMGLGLVGRGAVRTLLRLGCSVIGLDINGRSLSDAVMEWSEANFKVDYIDNLNDYLDDADLIVNCVKWPKEREDHLISIKDLKNLKPTAVIADISCDTAGAIESCKPTSWANPTYKTEGITHFCVDNIPGAIPVCASAGYAEAILPKVKLIANVGALEACRQNKFLARGLTCANGEIILKETGIVQKRPYIPVDEYLKNNE